MREREKEDVRAGERHMTKTAWLLISLMTLARPSPDRGQALDLDAAVDSITSRLTERVGGASTLRVATAELLDSAGDPNALGRLIADRLAVSLAARAEFQVIGRRELERALDELDLKITDLLEPQRAAAVGARLNCDAVLVGRIGELDDEVVLTVRMIDVGTRRVFEETSAILRKNVVVDDLLRRKQRVASERASPKDADEGPATNATGAAEWPPITRWGIEFTLRQCPASEPGTSLNRGTQFYCQLVVTNNPEKQDWLRIFQIGSYASDAEGVRIPLIKVYSPGLLGEGFYSDYALLPSSGRPILLFLKFAGSRQLGDVTSIVISVQTQSSLQDDLEFNRVSP
jgi:hypothetical protein